MFKPAAMRQVNIFVLEEDILDVTLALGRQGVLHLVELEDAEAWERSDSDRWSELADRYEDLKRQLNDILDTLEISRDAAHPLDHIEPVGTVQGIEDEIDEVKDALQDWSARRDAVEEEIERLELLQYEAQVIGPLEVSIEKLRALKHIHLVIGSLPQENLERLRMVLFRIPFVIIPIYEHEDWVLVFAASAEEKAPVLDRALDSALFDRLELSEDVTGPPQEVQKVLEARLEEAQARQKELEQERDALVDAHKDRLLALWRRAVYNAVVMKTINRFGRHEETYLISGWVPQEDLEKVVETVDAVAEEKTDVEVIEAGCEQQREQRQQVPILLKNPSFLQPFQKILSVFGFPAYDQVDPTPIVALTFVLMFGMMFGDVGHGLVLALIGVWLSWRNNEGMSSLAPVMIAAGVTGAIFGILYGSLFGREDILPHLWLSPLEEITTILLVSIAGGVVILNIGFLLHLASAWRSREWDSLLFSENGLAGIGLYWMLLGGGVMIARGAALPIMLWLLALLVPSGLILLREPLARLIAGDQPLLQTSWTAYATRTFFEFFESLLGYFTNSVSFVRLGAFAVAHAALGRVVFIMADLSRGLGHWLIVLLGTAIIIGFEGMVVGRRLTAREELLDHVWERGGQELRALIDDRDAYRQTLRRLVWLAVQTLGPGHVVLSADSQGHDLLTEGRLATWAEEASEDFDASVEFERASDPLDTWGGLIASKNQGRKRMDARFSARLEMAKREIRDEIFNVLMGES